MPQKDQAHILDQIARAKALDTKRLDFSFCDFDDERLPPELFELSQLEHISFYCTNLKILPEQFSSLTNLKYLELVSDIWEGFPEAICHLKNLEILVMGGVDVSGPGADYYLGYGVFEFSYPNTTSIPKTIANLQNLRILDLVTNRIKDIPEELTTLVKLETLKLDYNLIEHLPLGLPRMPNLKVLTLSHNPILENIPAEIVRQSVSWDGVFTSAGADLNNAVQNKLCDYLEYKYSGAYTKTKDRGLQDLFNYLKGIEKESVNVSLAKMLVLGNGYAGKTSIIHRLVNDSFKEVSPEDRTHGIILTDWAVNGTRVNIWDFGGQEIYHGTHQLFLAENVLYLIVLDQTSNERTLAYWLDFIGQNLNKKRVIVVQNKQDLGYAKIENFSALLRENKVDKTVHYISTKKGIGFRAFKEAIKEAITDIRVMNPLPRSWEDMAMYLQSQLLQGRKLLTYDDFVGKCKREAIDSSTSNTILKYLHERGNIFFKKELFNEQIVLNQQWVVDNIYKVLENNSLKFVNKGVMTMKDTREIWPTHKEEERQLFLSFMLSCELCFTETINCYTEEYIVPRLLPAKDPFIETIWDNEDNFHLIIQHRYLHSRTMERFLVKVGQLANRQYWKDCVIISDKEKNAKAIVESLYAEGAIKIRVNGKGKLPLLHSIRNSFKSIEYKKSFTEYLSLDGVEFIDLNLLDEKVWKNHSRIETINGTELSIDSYLQFAKSTPPKMPPIKFFISYSHKDRKYKDRLMTGLALAKEEKRISVWQDAEILPGQEFEKEIYAVLYACKIICLLISPDFVNSVFCFSKEMKVAVERHQAGEVYIVPIIVRDTPGWHKLEIGKIKAVPEDGKPISNWSNKDKAWGSVVNEIDKLITHLEKSR